MRGYTGNTWPDTLNRVSEACFFCTLVYGVLFLYIYMCVCVHVNGTSLEIRSSLYLNE